MNNDGRLFFLSSIIMKPQAGMRKGDNVGIFFSLEQKPVHLNVLDEINQVFFKRDKYR